MAADGDHVEANTFVFADLAGFTALTEAHGDDSATMIAGDFTASVREILASYDAEEVKTIGDEVMIRVADPNVAVRLGMRIAEELAFHGSPPVRVGMHSGPAVRRDGDWFGSTVNLASRVTDAAHPGEVLLTDETRRRLDQDGDFELEDRGAQYFRHVPELVAVYRAANRSSTADSGLEVDPVCRMAVARDRADSMKKRRGIAYYFCSAACRRQFDEDPRRYIAFSPGARAARKGFLINLTAFVVVGAAHLAGWAARDFSDPAPGMLVLLLAWAIALAIHYRAVRSVI
jgi:adenylate cyclase